MKLWELFIKYENGQIKDEEVFKHRNYSRMTATFKLGNFVWCNDYSAITCKDITKDIWIHIK